MNHRSTLLVLCPLAVEAAAARALRLPGAVVKTIGPGPDRFGEHAAQAVRDAQRSAMKLRVLLFGVAGAIRPLTFQSRAAWIDRVVCARDRSVITPTLAPPFGVNACGVLGSDAILHTAADKARAAGAFPAASLVDTESHAFARTMIALRVPWGIIRGVSDLHTQALPAQVIDWVSPAGRTRLFRVMWDLMRSPGLLSAVQPLAHATRTALDDAGALLRNAARDYAQS